MPCLKVVSLISKAAWTRVTTSLDAKVFRTILQTAPALRRMVPQPKLLTVTSCRALRPTYLVLGPITRNTWTPLVQSTKFIVTTPFQKARTSPLFRAVTIWTAPILVQAHLHVPVSPIPMASAHSRKALAIQRQALVATAPILSSSWPSVP